MLVSNITFLNYSDIFDIYKNEIIPHTGRTEVNIG